MSIYFIRADNGPVKIGYAQNPTHRLKVLQCAHYLQLHLLRVIDGGYDTEQWFHLHYSDLHIRGEWFKFHKSMMNLVPTSLTKMKKETIVDEYKAIRSMRIVAEANGCSSEYVRKIVSDHENKTGEYLGRRVRPKI